MLWIDQTICHGLLKKSPCPVQDRTEDLSILRRALYLVTITALIQIIMSSKYQKSSSYCMHQIYPEKANIVPWIDLLKSCKMCIHLDKMVKRFGRCVCKINQLSDDGFGKITYLVHQVAEDSVMFKMWNKSLNVGPYEMVLFWEVVTWWWRRWSGVILKLVLRVSKTEQLTVGIFRRWDGDDIWIPKVLQ